MVSELPWLSSGSVSVLAGGKEVELPQGVSTVVQSWKKRDTSVSSSPVKPGWDLSIVFYVRPSQYLPVPGLIGLAADISESRSGSNSIWLTFPSWISGSVNWSKMTSNS